jgi:hypothetical protein
MFSFDQKSSVKLIKPKIIKNKIGILAILSLTVGLSFFYPQQQADAIPGWGGTIEKDCVVYKCVSGCDSFCASATLAFLRLAVGLDVQKD